MITLSSNNDNNVQLIIGVTLTFYTFFCGNNKNSSGNIFTLENVFARLDIETIRVKLITKGEKSHKIRLFFYDQIIACVIRMKGDSFCQSTWWTTIEINQISKIWTLTPALLLVYVHHKHARTSNANKMTKVAREHADKCVIHMCLKQRPKCIGLINDRH